DDGDERHGRGAAGSGDGAVRAGRDGPARGRGPRERVHRRAGRVGDRRTDGGGLMPGINARVGKRIGLWGLVISLQGGAVARGDDAGSGSRFLSTVARTLAPAVTVEAEDGDIEAMLSFTILDRLPDLTGGMARLWGSRGVR